LVRVGWLWLGGPRRGVGEAVEEEEEEEEESQSINQANEREREIQAKPESREEDSHTKRLQELHAIKEILAIQTQTYERQLQEQEERLRHKYKQKLSAIRKSMEDQIARRVETEREKLADEFERQFEKQLESLHHQLTVNIYILPGWTNYSTHSFGFHRRNGRTSVLISKNS